MSDVEPIFDKDLLEDLKSLADEGEVLPMALYNKFIETTEERLEQIKELHRANNFKEMKDVAHSLKGSSYNMAAKRMGNVAAALEKASLDQDKTLSEGHLRALESEYKLLKEEIQKIVSCE
jgi:HPt (histidine-containing phosphotransfer) domain-containing protein